MHGSSPDTRGFLLDTNIVVAILNRDHSITQQITPDMKIHVPCIALGEAIMGAHRSRRIHQNLQAIKSFSKTIPIMACNAGTAEAYGVLHARLLNKGSPIPDNDVWIAAIAHQRGFTLITRDAHFNYIDFLSVLVW